MKQSLLLYLFILALIFNIFTYAYYSKQVDFQTTQIEKLTEKFESKDDEDFVDNFDEDGEPIDGESDDEFEDEEIPSDEDTELDEVMDKLESFIDTDTIVDEDEIEEGGDIDISQFNDWRF